MDTEPRKVVLVRPMGLPEASKASCTRLSGFALKGYWNPLPAQENVNIRPVRPPGSLIYPSPLEFWESGLQFLQYGQLEPAAGGLSQSMTVHCMDYPPAFWGAHSLNARRAPKGGSNYNYTPVQSGRCRDRRRRTIQTI